MNQFENRNSFIWNSFDLIWLFMISTELSLDFWCTRNKLLRNLQCNCIQLIATSVAPAYGDAMMGNNGVHQPFLLFYANLFINLSIYPIYSRRVGKSRELPPIFFAAAAVVVVVVVVVVVSFPFWVDEISGEVEEVK